MKKVTNLTTPPRFASHPFNKLKGSLHTPLTAYRLPLAAYLIPLFAFCLLSGTLFAQQLKNIQTAEFGDILKANPKDVLTVDTKFTKVIFQEWEKNEMEFTTTVTMRRATEKEFGKLLLCVNRTHQQLEKNTTYKLRLNDSYGKTNNFEIVLVVKIPKDIFINIESSFGDVEMPNVLNDFKANVDFGNLNIQKLSGNSNKIKIVQGKLTIGQVNHLSLDASFSQVSINDVGAINLNSDFSTIKIDVAKQITLSSKQDKVHILNNIDKIEGTMSFGTLKIKSLKQTCVFRDFSFSKVTIEEVLKSFTNITFIASQSTIALNIPEDLSFKFDYSGSFTKFRDENNIKLNEVVFKASNNSTQMSGIYGKNSDSGKTVKIHASFGSVSLFEK
jgi:hypothetical protein